MVVINKEHGIDEISIFLENKTPLLYERLICPIIAIFYDVIHNITVRKEIKKWNTSQNLFQDIEIETINRCNGNCLFCPVNKNADPRVFTLMSVELFDSIIDQLRELGYCGTVCFNVNNEPLLDKRIDHFLKVAREKLPNAYFIMYTNGTLLEIDRLNNILQYLDKLYIDNYNELRCINPKIQRILEYLKDKNQFSDKVEVNIIRPNAIRTTRGGSAPNRTKVFFLHSPCIYPFHQLNVRSDGKIIMCCNDALGKLILGDLNTETISSVWYGTKYQRFRETISKGRHFHSVCKNCDAFLLFPEILYKLKRLI